MLLQEEAVKKDGRRKSGRTGQVARCVKCGRERERERPAHDWNARGKLNKKGREQRLGFEQRNSGTLLIKTVGKEGKRKISGERGEKERRAVEETSAVVRSNTRERSVCSRNITRAKRRRLKSQ